MKELIMYRCEMCGNLICMVENSGVVPVCCGVEMTHVIANTEDASSEKHVPVIRREGTEVRVIVGEQPHPMTVQHHISMIFLLTNKGMHTRCLNADDDAEATFNIDLDENVIAAYAWCNLHGLWKN